MTAPHRSQHGPGWIFWEGPTANGSLPRRKAMPWEGGNLRFAVWGQEANDIWSISRTPFSCYPAWWPLSDCTGNLWTPEMVWGDGSKMEGCPEAFPPPWVFFINTLISKDVLPSPNEPVSPDTVGRGSRWELCLQSVWCESWIFMQGTYLSRLGWIWWLWEYVGELGRLDVIKGTK